MINRNKHYEDYCLPFERFFQETLFEKGILKFPDIISSVLNNLTIISDSTEKILPELAIFICTLNGISANKILNSIKRPEKFR